jgi:hypothetical protein
MPTTPSDVDSKQSLPSAAALMSRKQFFSATTIEL